LSARPALAVAILFSFAYPAKVRSEPREQEIAVPGRHRRWTKGRRTRRALPPDEGANRALAQCVRLSKVMKAAKGRSKLADQQSIRTPNRTKAIDSDHSLDACAVLRLTIGA
jgi:hypothetical protein